MPDQPAVESKQCPYCGISISANAYDNHVTPCHVAHMADPWTLGRAAGIRMTHEASQCVNHGNPGLAAVAGIVLLDGI